MKLNTSFHQKRLWFTDKSEKESLYESNPVYFNVPLIIKSKGELKTGLLKKSINAVINRHEALRTKIIAEGGESFQLISEESHFRLNEFNLQDKNEEDAYRFAISETQKPFSLEGDSLFRVSIIKFESSKYILVICAHNIICDRYSIKLIAEEIFLFYNSFLNNSEIKLPEIPVQFADFAEWQNELSSSEILDPAIFYWKKKLDGKISPLELPYDIPREAMHIYKYVYKRFDISETLSGKIKSYCEKEKIKYSSFFLSIYNLLLYKYSYQDEIIAGTYSENRKQEDIKKVAGSIENLIPVRTFISPSEKVNEFIKSVDKNFNEANIYSDIPFDKLVLVIKPEKDMSRNPLFDVVYRYEDNLTQLPKVDNIKPEVIETNLGFGKYDLNLLIQNDGDTFSGYLTSNLELFHEATIKRMIEHFKIILERVLDDTDVKISKLSLLSKEEENKILNEWNDTKAAYPEDLTIHQLFENQASKTPENIAIVFGCKSLNYSSLNKKSDLLAFYLRNNCGVKRNDLVCVMLDKSEYMIVTLLAILKSGGAYVPIDPTYPQQRINHILDNCKSNIIITTSNYTNKIKDTFKGEVIKTDEVRNKLENDAFTEIKNINEPDDVAYIIYTSGTTGNPKGCMVTHKNVVRLMINSKMPFDFTEKDVWIMAHSFCFDFSVWEMYGALLYGGKLIVPKKDEVRDISEFLSLVKQNKITVLNQTPMAFYNLISEEKNSENKSLDNHLRYVIFGGDKLELPKLKGWADRYSLEKVKLINMYGITETTVHVTFYRIKDSDINSRISKSPIGIPIPGTTVYVFDSNFNLLPARIKGEFYVGGSGVAKGYLFKDGLTSERFLMNPYKPTEKIYKTGDEGFWLPDGNLEYVGRIDNQVKIRGFRIELGEIENSILSYGKVKESVVLTKETKAGDKRLVAFIATDNNSVTSNDLRQYLKDKLPDYMVPSSYVFLKQFPMTTNGKIDKKALSNTELTRNELESKYIPPQSSEEKTLAKIWQEVIGIDKVGLNDNFFELGGDSIMSIQIIARANQEGLKIIPKQIFQYQTISELSKVIEKVMTSFAEQESATGSVPLTPIQHWFFKQNLPEPDFYNHSVLLKVPKNLNEKFLKESVEEIIKHHDALRLRFKKNKYIPEQINSGLSSDKVFSVVDLSNISSDKYDDELEKSIPEFQRSLNLSDGPLIKALLFKAGSNDEDRLLIVIHHLCIDGISWRIILEDLFNSYKQLSIGEKIKLPPKTTSFKDWSNKLIDFRRTEEEINYWCSILDLKSNKMPTDFSSDEDKNTVESADKVSIELDGASTQSILKDVPKTYNTQINDILLSALAIAYSSWCDESKMLISLEGHGREDLFESIDVSRTMGWFTSMFPVVLEIYNKNNIGESIKLVKENLRQIPNNGIGFGLLKYLNTDENIKAKFKAFLKPEIVFNYLGQLNENIIPNSDWKLGKKSIILSQNKNGLRTHLIEINSIVADNKLRMDFNFSKNIHKKETIETFAKNYEDALKNIVEHCTNADTGGYTPSDFEAAGLNQQELDNLFANLN